jgi:glyoxylase-like metal-dependent hydrolase (beta-lactamase superfamily II)
MSGPELRELAPGAWAWLQLPGGWGESNAGLIAGDDASLLVDTLWDQRRTAVMLASLARVAPPIAVAVNTHADGDHWWGNAELAPDVRIVTSEGALAAMREEDPAELARLGRLARAGARLPVPLLRYTDAMLGPFAHDEVAVRLPGDTFTGRRTELGCELIDVGPTHTAADLVVHAPEHGVVFAGDVLFNRVTPILWHGPLAGWLAAIDLLLGLDAEVFLPGHGEPMAHDDVRAFRDYWTWLDGVVADRRARGDDPWAATQAAVTDPGFAPYRGWLGPERIYINVLALHSGRPVEGGRRAIFTRVARLARELG